LASPEPADHGSERRHRVARNPVAWLFLFCIVVAGGYWLFGPDHHAAVVVPDPPGWRALGPCSILTSFDGRKLLTLDRKHGAMVHVFPRARVGRAEEKQRTGGHWDFNVEDDTYALNIEGSSTSYNLISLEHSNLCIMAKGNAASADLRASWFAVVEPDPPDYDPEQ
jgi:hypothetical protein